MQVQKQGYWYSENGWPMIDTGTLDFSPVPDLNWRLGVHIGVPNTLLKALIVRIHREVEPVIISQTGCFTVTNSMANSNHNSATAVDINWLKHPYQKWGTWGSKRALVDKIISDFRGTIEFGGNWTSPRDEMHFELAFGPANKAALDLANELWQGGLWGIFKPGAPPVANQPLPPIVSTNDLFKGVIAPDRVKILQNGFNVIFRSYPQCPLAVDGDFGPATDGAVRELQRRAGLVIDGVVGANTRAYLVSRWPIFKGI